MQAKKKTFTYADYERLPEGAPYRLIGEELVMTPSLCLTINSSHRWVCSYPNFRAFSAQN